MGEINDGLAGAAQDDSGSAEGAGSRPARRWKATLPSAIALSLTLAVLVFVLSVKALGMRIVLPMDKSLGNRAYLCTERKPDRIFSGDFVEFPFPADTPYYRKGQPFLKMVGCAPGQELKVEAGKNYYCDGRHIGTAKDTDSKGNPVENFVHNGPVPQGMLFVVGTNPKSYDSRYWGFLPVADVTGKCYAITP